MARRMLGEVCELVEQRYGHQHAVPLNQLQILYAFGLKDHIKPDAKERLDVTVIIPPVVKTTLAFMVTDSSGGVVHVNGLLSGLGME